MQHQLCEEVGSLRKRKRRAQQKRYFQNFAMRSSFASITKVEISKLCCRQYLWLTMYILCAILKFLAHENPHSSYYSSKYNTRRI